MFLYKNKKNKKKLAKQVKHAFGIAFRDSMFSVCCESWKKACGRRKTTGIFNLHNVDANRNTR